MALPLVPFAAGFAVGSLATYIWKDKETQELFFNSADKVRQLGRNGYRYVADGVAQGAGALTAGVRSLLPLGGREGPDRPDGEGAEAAADEAAPKD
jgi:hypothetical protein